MADSQHKYLRERGWSQQQIDEVIRKAHEWLRGAGYTPLTEQGHWNGIMGSTQSYHLPSREKDARGMTEAFVEMLKGGKILDASRVHKFSRPGAKATFKVEDRFYFGKGRKERFDRYGYEKMDYDRLVRESWHLKDSAEYAVSLGRKDNELRQKMSALQKEFIRRGFTAAATVLDAALRKPFSRPGKPERFASISRPKQSVTSGPTGTWKKREVTVRGIKAWLVELYRGGILVGYLNQHPDTRQFHAFDGKNDQQIGVGSEAEMKRLVESL